MGKRKAAESDELEPVVAFDLATRTGWAVMRPDGVIVSGVKSFQPTRLQGAGMRFLLFRQWLDELKASHRFTSVYFEEVRGHVATIAAQIYGGFAATLTAWCEEREVPYLGVHTGVWKKALTGAGNAKKDLVQRCVAERLALAKPLGPDESDAIGVLLHGTNRLEDGSIQHVTTRHDG